MAELFTLETPKGELVKIKTPEGEVKMEIRWNSGFGADMTKKIRSAQEFVDSECLRLCSSFIPRDTGILEQSGIMHTQIGSGEVRWRTPYARRWYYQPANFSKEKNPQAGNYWFE